MAKNLDGIKKLNAEEVKKYRKIVLDYIGEKDASAPEEKDKPVESTVKKAVDGINFNNAKNKSQNKKDNIDEAVKRQEEERKRILEEEKQFLIRKEREKNDKLLKEQDKIRQEKLVKEEKDKKLNELKEKQLKEKEELIRMEKIKQIDKERQAKELIERERKDREEKIKREELKKKENSLADKVKRQEELKKIKSELQKSAQIAAEKRKIKRRKAIKKFRKNFKIKFEEILNSVKKNIVYAISLAAVITSLAYIIFSLLVLRFNQFEIVKQAAGFLPVPAAITTEGVISYNDFKNIQTNSYLALNLKEKKNSLIKWLIINNLGKRYGSVSNLDIKFAADEKFNQVEISRINKIKVLLDAGNSMDQLSKYADEFSAVSYYGEKEAVEKFGTSILNLSSGQTSGIITRPAGFYIIKRLDDNNDKLGLSFLFVSAKSLDEYINEKIKNAKIFILAN